MEKPISETKQKLKIYMGTLLHYIGMVYNWFTEFCCGYTNMNDAECSGRPNEITTENMVNNIHDIK